VTLNNTVTGSTPTHFVASESSTFTGAAWQTYSTAPSFTLSSGSGNKTVYFKVKNASGTASVVKSDTISLVEPAPGGVYGILRVNAAGNPTAPGAVVTCGGQSTTTGEDGSFGLPGILPGSQSLCFSNHGYQPLCSTVPITGGQNYNAGDNYLVITGDINADGKVDGADYSILHSHFGKTNCGNPADLDGNCVVDILDYNLFIENNGRTS
jgi:hypothetical protein